MEAYKFEATILQDGVIKIPQISQFANREVEVFIMLKPKPKSEPPDPQAIEQFLQSLTGILKGFNPDTLKEQYLQEKYK